MQFALTHPRALEPIYKEIITGFVSCLELGGGSAVHVLLALEGILRLHGARQCVAQVAPSLHTVAQGLLEEGGACEYAAMRVLAVLGHDSIATPRPRTRSKPSGSIGRAGAGGGARSITTRPIKTWAVRVPS